LADLVGDTSLLVNTIALFLLVIGVVRRRGSKKVLIRHGYLSILGFAMKMATVLVIMIPSFLMQPFDMAGFSSLQLWLIGAKAALGILGTIMGFICIVPWFFKPLEQMACNRVKRWMLPTFIVWAANVALGAVLHLGEII
jgi:hypothetical protein